MKWNSNAYDSQMVNSMFNIIGNFSIDGRLHAKSADVDDRAETILHQIHTRPVRKLAEFVPDVFGRRHGDNVPKKNAFWKGRAARANASLPRDF